VNHEISAALIKTYTFAVEIELLWLRCVRIEKLPPSRPPQRLASGEPIQHHDMNHWTRLSAVPHSYSTWLPNDGSIHRTDRAITACSCVLGMNSVMCNVLSSSQALKKIMVCKKIIFDFEEIG
jgi:hypothetical protein